MHPHDDRAEMVRALTQFRAALIEVLAGIQVQLATLEAALQKGTPWTRELRQEMEIRRERFRGELAQRLPPAHEAR